MGRADASRLATGSTEPKSRLSTRAQPEKEYRAGLPVLLRITLLRPTNMISHRIALLWIAAAGLPGLSRADTVFLNNSDRLSGEIQKLEGKHLYLKTAYAGIVEIDWTMVQSISSDRELRISMQNGMILSGTLQNTTGGILVSSVSPDTPILPRDVKAISAPVKEETFRDHLDGSIELGYSLSGGNSPLNQSSVAASAEYQSERLHVQTDLSSLFSKQAPAESTSTHSASARVDWYLTPGAFVFALGGLDRDNRQLLNLRTTLGAGMGWQIAHTRDLQLSLLGGLTFVNESYSGGDAAHPGHPESTGEALAGLSLDRLQWGRLRFTGKMSIFPSILDQGRVRAVMNTGVRMPVVSRLIWSLRLFERFDSRPVLAVKKHDYGLISSFGFSF